MHLTIDLNHEVEALQSMKGACCEVRLQSGLQSTAYKVAASPDHQGSGEDGRIKIVIVHSP